MKNTLLLATVLFLIGAPAPDSSDIAEMTSNFIVPQDIPGLQADEESTSGNLDVNKQNAKQISATEYPAAKEHSQAANTRQEIQPFKD